MNKKQLTERDICTKYITPALERAGVVVLVCIQMITVKTSITLFIRMLFHYD